VKENIHPQYGPTQVTCACGNAFMTRSTQSKIQLDICNVCHPFFTGQQKLIDRAGRVERFQKRLAKASAKPSRKAKLKKIKRKTVRGSLLTTMPKAAKKKKKK